MAAYSAALTGVHLAGSREVCLFSHQLDTGEAMSRMLCLCFGPPVEEHYLQTGRNTPGSPKMVREVEHIQEVGRGGLL